MESMKNLGYIILKFNNKRNKKYLYLLTKLTANFVFSGFVAGDIGRLLLSASFLWAIMAVVKSFCLDTLLFRVFIGIGILAFLIEVIGGFGLFESVRTYFFLVQGVYIIYSATATYLILRNMRSRDRVTADLIYAGICIYLLIGFIFAFVYGVIISLDPQAFSQSMIEIESYGENIYLSFTTLTTVGYGDITPVSSWAKMFTNVEAIIGQLYPSVFLSILVSEYLSHRTR